MNITNIKDLEAVLALCRRKGVESITVSGIDIKFDRDSRPTPKRKEKASDPVTDTEYTPEQILTWSSAGIE